MNPIFYIMLIFSLPLSLIADDENLQKKYCSYLWTQDPVMIWKQCLCLDGCFMRIQDTIDEIRKTGNMELIDQIEYEVGICRKILYSDSKLK